MNSQEELLSFLDFLDLDEEVIDTRLKSIMVRTNYTNQHLVNALQLLRYKNLINIQENTECDNADEFDFVAKLIKDITEDTVDNVCRITNTVLKLNASSLVSYSEHLLLQILSNIDLSIENSNSSESENEKPNTLLYLKICDSVLDATKQVGEKLSLLFLETPLENILNSGNEQIKIHFITNSVPKLVDGIVGYDILNRIWSYLEKLKGDGRTTALKVLSSLSDYYLPVVIGGGTVKYESTLIHNGNFWDIVLYGLMSDDPSLRKISVYLAKRAIDYVNKQNVSVAVKLKNLNIFTWNNKKCELFKNQWDNFFILIDSLEEKQSNIVLPSLQLFDSFTEINHCWLNCTYNIGLKHDNGQVRLKCVEHRLKTNIDNVSEATVLLEALNDINFYENAHDCKVLIDKLSMVFKCENNLINILKAIPLAHLSPIPFYHLSVIIAKLEIVINSNVSQAIVDILKTSCNIVTVREAIHFNIAHFVGRSCKTLPWKEVANIFGILQSETWVIRKVENAMLALISSWKLCEAEKEEFYKYVTESHLNIEIGMLYLDNHLEDRNVYVEIVTKKVEAIQDVVHRQYSNKMDCFNDVQYIINMQKKCRKDIKEYLPETHKIIIQYIYCLLSSDIALTIDETKSIFSSIHFIKEEDLKDLVLQLYKMSLLVLQNDQTNLDKVVQSLLIVDCLSHNNYFVDSYRHEMLDFKHLLKLKTSFEKKEGSNAQSLGRLRNVFYETHCKIVYKYLENEDSEIQRLEPSHQPFINTDIKNETSKKVDNSKEITDYVEKVIECGGYGCLEWILKIVNKTFEYANSHLSITQFINRMWREIEELKSSNQYLPCMMEFVKLITQKTLIDNLEYNNIVILYCSKIIEYGLINNSPLYYLVDNGQFCLSIKEQNEKNEYGHLVYILSEILLFCPVPRKDQRVADNLALEILKKFGEECIGTELHFNLSTQYKSVHILSGITDPSVLQALTKFITAKIDNTFRAKLRYHGNSQIHRTFQTALQHLLYISFLKSNLDGHVVSNWCIELLGRLPHQISVRICLEWYIALQFYMEKAILDKQFLQVLQYKNVPLTSQFIITYWLLKIKITNGIFSEEEFEFVMDTLISHTMGQMFNIRLLAQYLTTKLYEQHKSISKYQYIVEVIRKTLEDNAKDKNFVKLKEDYFMNDFDIVSNLTPFFIYYTLPRLCEVGNNEAVDIKLILDSMEDINKNTERLMNPTLKEEWIKNHKRDEEFVHVELIGHIDKKINEDVEVLRTIQKKYIPWKSMSDINVYNVEKKRESPSDLIVVASLIDKLPNLGGMARTSEVFGVKTYVIDSLRHVQDRQFQGLSVSAERWINVEEVRPGQTLKEYLNRKKAEGYSVVAAEQTSTSSKLQSFKFPRKTLLLLGHEKEGIPCDLLPMMDHCVEIPQQGFVRSLNVHVTAAIFVWEYARQNLL